jgi:GNAT superfamily N-acetyltransferase
MSGLTYSCGWARPEDVELFASIIRAAQMDSDSNVRHHRPLDRIVGGIAPLVEIGLRYAAARDERELVGVFFGCDHDRLWGVDASLPPRPFYMSDLAVLPAYRRRGVAIALVETLIREVCPPYEHVFLHALAGSRCFEAFVRRGWSVHGEHRGRAGLLKRFDTAASASRINTKVGSHGRE